MDKSKKYRVNQWVETALYGLLEEAMAKRQIAPADATALTPLIQMYQAIQLENVSDELNSLWLLLAEGQATIRIGDEVTVKIKRKPQQMKRGTNS